MNVNFSILKILQSCLIIIRVDINYEEDGSVNEKEKATDVFVIKKIFIKRKAQVI